MGDGAGGGNRVQLNPRRHANEGLKGMKALMILIVSVGTSQASLDGVDSNLEVRQIEFSSLAACERAADTMTHAGRATSDWAKTFSVNRRDLFVSPPTIVAECLEL